MIERLLQRDMWVKAAAVALALFMWFQVINEQNPLETRNIYLNLEFSAAPGKCVTFKSPDRVTVTLQGRARTLDQIDVAGLTIPVDISSLDTGSNQVPIEFASPVGGVRVTDINPKSAVVSLDDEETKQVSVNVQTKGVPDEEYEVQSPVSELATVSVTGPRAQVQMVVAAFGTVDISGAAGTLENRQVALTAVDDQSNTVPDVELSPDNVTVSVPMKSRPPAKMVTVRPETRGAPKAGYRVKSVYATPGSIKVRGEASLTSRLSSIATSVIEISDRTQTFTYSANLIIPQDVTTETNRVNVTIEIEEDIVTKTFPEVIVQIESLPVGYTWDLDSKMVDITIEGRRDVLEEIERNFKEDPSVLEAFIDASWIKEPGSHKMVVNVRGLPDSVRFDSIVPSHVILELKVR